MNATLLATSPLWLLGAGAVVILLLIAQRRGADRIRRASAFYLGLAATGAALALLTGTDVAQVTPLFAAGGTEQLIGLLFCLFGLGAVSLPSRDALSTGDQHEEYYLLQILAVLGATVLAYAEHAASLVLGLELLSLAMYALIAYPAARPVPLEAAIKYMLLSGAASATLLFGLALLYAQSGSLAFDGLVATPVRGGDGFAAAGATLVLVGLALKAAVVPFHLWTPDVYDGAPTPVSALLVAVTKGAAVLALYHVGFTGGLLDVPAFSAGLGLLATASILVGTWMALLQDNAKRLLAYSSIAHSGYLILALAAGSVVGARELALEAGVFYLVTYLLGSYAAFAVLAHVENAGDCDARPAVMRSAACSGVRRWPRCCSCWRCYRWRGFP